MVTESEFLSQCDFWLHFKVICLIVEGLFQGSLRDLSTFLIHWIVAFDRIVFYGLLEVWTFTSKLSIKSGCVKLNSEIFVFLYKLILKECPISLLCYAELCGVYQQVLIAGCLNRPDRTTVAIFVIIFFTLTTNYQTNFACVLLKYLPCQVKFQVWSLLLLITL